MENQGQLILHIHTVFSVLVNKSDFGIDTLDVAIYGADHNTPHSRESTSSENMLMPVKTIQCPPSAVERALVRRIDCRLIPILFLIYVAAFLDR